MQATMYTSKTFQAVIHPEQFPPFPMVTTQQDFEECWKTNRAWVLANMCHTAYHPQESIVWLMKKFGAQETRIYERNGAQAFLAVWRDRAILTFRGTQAFEKKKIPTRMVKHLDPFLERTLKVHLPDEYNSFVSNDILADLMFGLTPLGQAEVHRGFLREFTKIWKPLILSDLQVLTDPQNIPVSITGHSLGGAMATLAGIHKRFHEVVTFGEPRVGRRISRVFKSRQHLRFVNGNDPIPKLPPRWWPFSYVHHGCKQKIGVPDGSDAVYDHSILYYAQNLAYWLKVKP